MVKVVRKGNDDRFDRRVLQEVFITGGEIPSMVFSHGLPGFLLLHVGDAEEVDFFFQSGGSGEMSLGDPADADDSDAQLFSRGHDSSPLECKKGVFRSIV
jgi:hypothetical protein